MNIVISYCYDSMYLARPFDHSCGDIADHEGSRKVQTFILTFQLLLTKFNEKKVTTKPIEIERCSMQDPKNIDQVAFVLHSLLMSPAPISINATSFGGAFHPFGIRDHPKKRKNQMSTLQSHKPPPFLIHNSLFHFGELVERFAVVFLCKTWTEQDCTSHVSFFFKNLLESQSEHCPAQPLLL